MARDSGGTGRWLVVRTWVVEADTAGEARAAAASERGWPLTVVADGAGVIESVCRAGHRYATCACQQPDCTGWKAISVGAHYPGVIPDQPGQPRIGILLR